MPRNNKKDPVADELAPPVDRIAVKRILEAYYPTETTSTISQERLKAAARAVESLSQNDCALLQDLHGISCGTAKTYKEVGEKLKISWLQVRSREFSASTQLMEVYQSNMTRR